MSRPIFLSVILLFSFIISSCLQDERILPKQKMIEVLTDMHLSDATVQIHFLKEKYAGLQQSHYDSIFSHHGITDSLFRWNMAYYQYTEDLEKMMAQVITRLSMIEGELQQETRYKPETENKDSVSDHEEAKKKLNAFDRIRFMKYDSLAH